MLRVCFAYVSVEDLDTSDIFKLTRKTLFCPLGVYHLYCSKIQ
jgi:hypothetical protein